MSHTLEESQQLRCLAWIGWLVLLVTTFLMLGFLEAALRFLPISGVDRIKMRQEIGKGVVEPHPQDLYRLHPEIGWTLTPEFRGEFKKDDFYIHVQANTDGLRDINYGKKQAGTFRILGLGDSFAFGWGVENEKSFFKVMEAKFENAMAGKRLLEVINAGIPGFGTYEALALTKSIGLKYEPDLAVLAFYEGNDYKNNGDTPRKREIRDGYLADITNVKPFFIRSITSSSVLAAFIESRMAAIFQKTRFAKDVERTERYLLDLKSVLDQKHIPLVLMFIPDQDAAVYRRSGLKWEMDRWLGGINLLDAREELEIFCRDNGIAFLRLSKEFEDGKHSAELRLKDTHFNVDGHGKAGEELYAFLADNLPKEVIS